MFKNSKPATISNEIVDRIPFAEYDKATVANVQVGERLPPTWSD